MRGRRLREGSCRLCGTLATLGTTPKRLHRQGFVKRIYCYRCRRTTPHLMNDGFHESEWTELATSIKEAGGVARLGDLVTRLRNRIHRMLTFLERVREVIPSSHQAELEVLLRDCGAKSE